MFNLDAVDADIKDRSPSEFFLEDSVGSDDLAEEDVDRVDVADRLLLQLLAKLNVGRQESVGEQTIKQININIRSIVWHS
jgi:hypothetical protein